MRQAVTRLQFAEATALLTEISTTLERRYSLRIADAAPRQGQLNFNWIAFGPREGKYLVSIPRQNDEIIADLYREYAGVGFFRLGGRFKLRTIPEVVRLTRRCHVRRIRAPGIVTWGSRYILRQYVPGIIYEDFLRTQTQAAHVAETYLQSLIQAHQRGIVLGDRWGLNEVVREDGTICFFDFDISLISCAREMELAQALYYSITNARQPGQIGHVAMAVCHRCSDMPYDWSAVQTLLEGHVAHFRPASSCAVAVREVIDALPLPGRSHLAPKRPSGIY